ncbi:ChuX/HutX family heme-like substrate-binding protein [Psychrobacter sp. FDAARGOS_221]|uniref:ChuX/HutX family heme-like substrate-binding protein n=1 Tax=Psychrobacter sp. FDAARGOS_221 TaxID=1975705 RepID=UPI000BB54F2A|nr:ChuX/HutX family heme-like substrate-binding protein [Psychrobacter sp. FDAARGOS_221]PNK59825.1 hemin-degrading factor [Psychrobacter sp. FDAARGOS_221]
MTTPQTQSTSDKNQALWQSYQQLKENDRFLFPLEGATTLKVSELELLLASPYSQYLGKDCQTVLQQLTDFSKIEIIVRNELAVHEKTGKLNNLKLGKHMGIALNVGGLDLRFFVEHWHHMLAISDTSKATDNTSASFSIQFFDDHGDAIAKVFLRDDSPAALAQWQTLVSEHAQSTATADIVAELTPKAAATKWQYKQLDKEDLQQLHQQWQQMQDVHQFHFILKNLQLDRASSYHQAPEEMAYQLQPEAIDTLLHLAQSSGDPIMIFVGNSGVVQIQTGAVHQVKRIGQWLNILDKQHTDFTLHLNDSGLAQVWCVKRPTKDGIVTCIEGFDDSGNSIISFFGQRQEGESEKEYWQQLCSQLVEQHAVTKAA